MFVHSSRKNIDIAKSPLGQIFLNSLSGKEEWETWEEVNLQDYKLREKSVLLKNLITIKFDLYISDDLEGISNS